MHYDTHCRNIEKNQLTKSQLSLVAAIHDKKATIDAHPMQAVQCQYTTSTIECTSRCIGCALIVTTVLLPIKKTEEDYTKTHMFFSVAIHFVLQCT